MPIVVAALLVIPIIAIEQSSVGEPWSTVAAVVNWLVWLLFLSEAAVMLAVVSNRWKWLREHPLEVAIVLLTPPFLPASLQALRLFRLLRLLRLLAVVRYVRRLFILDALLYGALLALVTVLGGGAAFAAAEGQDVSTWDGVWWAVTTMTTVGYGDLSPATDLGRVVAMIVMVVGIGFLSLFDRRRLRTFHGRRTRGRRGRGGDRNRTRLGAAQEEIIHELRAIATRVGELEASIRRLRG